MGNGGSQPSSGSELFDLEHAPLDLQLFHSAQRSQITQDSNGKRDLSPLVVNLSGTGVILNVLLGDRIGELKRSALFVGETKGERRDVCVKLSLVLNPDGIGHAFLVARREKVLSQRIQQYNLGGAVAHHDRIADTFNDYVQ